MTAVFSDCRSRDRSGGPPGASLRLVCDATGAGRKPEPKANFTRADCLSPPHASALVMRNPWSGGTQFFRLVFHLEGETNMRKFLNNKKGQGLVEYGLIIAGVALICAAAVSVFGHKTSDLISAVAAVLPGAHEDDNGPLVSGKLIETTGAATGSISLNGAAILANSDTPRLGNNVGLAVPEEFGGLVLEVGP
jgi:pilus assembly protein Flp/PilA